MPTKLLERIHRGYLDIVYHDLYANSEDVDLNLIKRQMSANHIRRGLADYNLSFKQPAEINIDIEKQGDEHIATLRLEQIVGKTRVTPPGARHIGFIVATDGDLTPEAEYTRTMKYLFRFIPQLSEKYEFRRIEIKPDYYIGPGKVQLSHGFGMLTAGSSINFKDVTKYFTLEINPHRGVIGEHLKRAYELDIALIPIEHKIKQSLAQAGDDIDALLDSEQQREQLGLVVAIRRRTRELISMLKENIGWSKLDVTEAKYLVDEKGKRHPCQLHNLRNVFFSQHQYIGSIMKQFEQDIQNGTLVKYSDRWPITVEGIQIARYPEQGYSKAS